MILMTLQLNAFFFCFYLSIFFFFLLFFVVLSVCSFFLSFFCVFLGEKTLDKGWQNAGKPAHITHTHTHHTNWQNQGSKKNVRKEYEIGLVEIDVARNDKVDFHVDAFESGCFFGILVVEVENNGNYILQFKQDFDDEYNQYKLNVQMKPGMAG